MTTQYYSHLSTDIESHKQQLTNQMDDFTTFTFDSVNTWDRFNMFIINEKQGGLKFYNGPSFSNEYSKAIFASNNTNLTGINFNTQVISFKVGMYYFDINMYRNMLKLFSPYRVGFLTFSFNPLWAYQVKLKSISDSPRYIIGSGANNQYYYYTEFQMSFEVQGPSCAYAQPWAWSQKSLVFNERTDTDTVHWGWDSENNFNQTITHTDLDSPLDLSFSFYPLRQEESSGAVDIKIEYAYTSLPNLDDKKIMWNSLVNLSLNNLTKQANHIYHLRYLSEQGLCLYHLNDNEDQLLTLITSSSNGKRLVELLEVNKFMITPDIDMNKLFFRISIKGGRFQISNQTTSSQATINLVEAIINVQARTNAL